MQTRYCGSIQSARYPCPSSTPLIKVHSSPFQQKVPALTNSAHELYVKAFNERSVAAKDKRLWDLIDRANDYPYDQHIVEEAICNISYFHTSKAYQHSQTVVSQVLRKPCTNQAPPTRDEKEAFLKLMSLSDILTEAEQQELEQQLKHWEYISLYLNALAQNLKKNEKDAIDQMRQFASKIERFPKFCEEIYNLIGEFNQELKIEGLQIFAQSHHTPTWYRLLAGQIVSHYNQE